MHSIPFDGPNNRVTDHILQIRKLRSKENATSFIHISLALVPSVSTFIKRLQCNRYCSRS